MAAQLLVQSEQMDVPLDLKMVLSHPLTPVPYSIGTVDGFLAKNDK